MLLEAFLVLLVVLSIVMIKRRPKKLMILHRQTKVDFPYIPIIGHAYKFVGSNEGHMLMFDDLGRQGYRNKHGMVSFWFANHLCICISDPIPARVVLKTCSDKWPFTILARHLLGNGSVFGEEQIWRLRRKIMTPMFASKYYDNFVQVFERNNKILVEELAAVVGKGDFSMWEYFSAYALDSALDMTFGENVNAQRHLNHPFVKAFEDYLKIGAARFCQPWLYVNTAYKLLPAAATQRYSKKVMWDFVESLIAKKQKAMSMEQLETTTKEDTSDTLKSKTFLELLMEFSGGEDGYTNIELREETLVLILAATDTSASAICFATLLLARHPEIQDRVYDELISTLPYRKDRIVHLTYHYGFICTSGRPVVEIRPYNKFKLIQKILGDSERTISADDLAKLKYLDAVAKESLRLYPSIPVSLRYCTKDIELPSGLILHEGCSVILNFWSIHRNPHYWGADADEFNPDRFLNATPEQLSVYIPFGYGPRNCTGMRLGMASMKLSLAEIIRRYRIAPATSYQYDKQNPLRVSFEIMLKHADNFKVRLENRV